jgi:hypothetical protein
MVLAAVPPGPNPLAGSTPRTECRAAEAALAQAEYEYQAVLATVPPVVDIAEKVDQPFDLLMHLETAVAMHVAAETERVADEYRQKRIHQESETILAAGHLEQDTLDRLCWRGINQGDSAVQLRSPQAYLNGDPVSDAWMRQVWGVPAGDQVLRIPGSDDWLLPGGDFEACFFARHDLPAPPAAAPGAPHPSRAGVWRLEFRDARLGEAPRGPSSAEAAAQALKSFEMRLPEARVLEMLVQAGAAVAVESARKVRQHCGESR